MPKSIQLRLVMAASLVLAAFLGLGGLALDKAYRESTEAATKERLLGYVYGLLAAAEEDPQGRMILPTALPDPRLSTPDSGLYAFVSRNDGTPIWRSSSLLGRSTFSFQPADAGVREYRHQGRDGDEFNVLNFGVLWEDFAGNELAYTLTVMEDAGPINVEVSAFRTSLLIWLGGASLLLLLAQGGVLRWGLRPLREVADDIEQVEQGSQEYLQGAYPRELNTLTQRINSLIRTGRVSRDRYRNSMGDLAHSLKTPLAVLQGATEGEDEESLRRVIREQVPRMNDIVQYQLKRAAASGRSVLSQSVNVTQVVERLCNSLQKVYREKGIVCSTEVAVDIAFYGDEGDLFELLGNLLENAFKYGNSQVRVTASTISAAEGASGGCRFVIEDDGPGISKEDRESVLKRGVRMDQQISGQGIGLSVADEIARIYEGRLLIDASGLGGAEIVVELP